MGTFVGVARYAAAGTVGVAAGGTLGIVGWGGAQVIKPCLTSPMMGCTHLQATATSLFSLSIAVVAGASQFVQSGNASIEVAMALAVPSMLGARFGSQLAGRMSADALALVFNGGSVLLLPTHYLIQHSRRNRQLQQEQVLQTSVSGTSVSLKRDDEAELLLAAEKMREPVSLAKHASFGFCMGVLSALMGVGGLPVAMSYLTVASPLPHHLIQGTAMCAVAPSVLVSSITHIQSGATPLGVAVAVTAGSVTGAALGARLALSLPEQTLRELFMASLVLLGGRSFVAAVRNTANIVRRWH
eukprot:SAG31_NODE_3723_length_3948_cov_4.219018_3_plen_300_part_00